MQKRKGFTLVELVIVIAVIAILAGVLIGTFASVINRANDSAKLQELKAQELQEKADDILKKIEDSNWYGWEDFEKSIVEKMTKVYTNSQGASVDAEDIKKAVKDAIKEYSENSTTSNTGLTEEQVKTIVEDAIGKIQFNGVTEAQVKTIIETALAAQTTTLNANALTAAQVKTIIDAANANNLTAADVSKVIGEFNFATKTDISDAVASIVSKIETTQDQEKLSVEDLSNAILSLLPVTYKVTSTTDLSAALASVNSFSTLYFTTNLGEVEISLDADDTRTLTIAGAKQDKITITAPLATINIVDEQAVVEVNSINDNSLHISSVVASLLMKKGRVVVENGGTVQSLTATPDENAIVKVDVALKAVVASLTLQLQNRANSAEKIQVENAGTVSAISVQADTTTTTTIEVVGTDTNKTAEEIAKAAAETDVTTNIVAGSLQFEVSGGSYETGDVETTVVLTLSNGVYLVRNADELRAVASLVNSDETYSTYGSAKYLVTADIDISNATWIPIGQTDDHVFTGTFDGGNKVISGMSNFANYDYVATAYHSISSGKDNVLYGLFNFVEGEAEIKNVNLTNVSVKMPSTSLGGGVGGGLVAYVNYYYSSAAKETKITNCTVSGTISGFDCVGSIVGRSNYGSPASGQTVTITNCSSTATLTVTRTDRYARVGGIVGYAQSGATTKILSCTFTGSCVGRLIKQGDLDTVPCGPTANGDYLCGSSKSNAAVFE